MGSPVQEPEQVVQMRVVDLSFVRDSQDKKPCDEEVEHRQAGRAVGNTAAPEVLVQGRTVASAVGQM